LSMLDISQVLFRVCLLLYMFGPWLGPCNSPSVFGGSFCAIHPPWTRDPPSTGEASIWQKDVGFKRGFHVKVVQLPKRNVGLTRGSHVKVVQLPGRWISTRTRLVYPRPVPFFCPATV
jgi:hypothetical protein